MQRPIKLYFASFSKLIDKIICRNVRKTHRYLPSSRTESVVILNIWKLLLSWKIIGSKRRKLLTKKHHIVNDCVANMEQFIVQLVVDAPGYPIFSKTSNPASEFMISLRSAFDPTCWIWKIEVPPSKEYYPQYI